MKKYICDKCEKEISDSGAELVLRYVEDFETMSIDLCKVCYEELKKLYEPMYIKKTYGDSRFENMKESNTNKK